MKKIFRTSRSQSKYTARYYVSYGFENEPCIVVFINSIRELRTFVGRLIKQGYEEQKTPLSLSL